MAPPVQRVSYAEPRRVPTPSLTVGAGGDDDSRCHCPPFNGNRENSMHDLLLKGGTVVDPSAGLEGLGDIAVRDGVIARIAKDIPSAEARRPSRSGERSSPLASS